MAEVDTHSKPSCLEADVIAGFLEDRLPTGTREQAADHFVSCDECREALTGLARLGTSEPQNYSSVVMDEEGVGLAPPALSEESVLAAGTTLGRYVVLSKVGAGGMGVVYSAYDPELDRRIAVKVIRTEILRDTDRAHAKLRDEARAMAQLTHPNVVRVYDVGTQGKLVYIAMEFIEGEDLREFAERQRGLGAWRPILEACLQAGRGLQAAHEAGLVHRDFKPSNVLCAKDGRVFVADFGLTRLFAKSTEETEPGLTTASGTPGYAAPEQVAGKPCDVASDQYSFCVTVAECLFGRDPMSTLIRMDDDKVQRMNCPKRLAPVLERGLARQTSGRHANMQDLLDELESRSQHSTRNRVVAASLGLVGGVGVLMFVLGAQASTPDDVCAAGGERFASLWDKDRHDNLDAALANTEYNRHAAYFLDTAETLARDLSEEQRFSCAATFKNKTQSPELFDRQMFCLNSHATELEAIIAMVEGGASVEAGQSALGSLPSVAECRISESLLAAPAPPTDSRSLARIQSVEDKLAQRRALEEARKPLDALQKVEDAILDAEAIGYAPLLTRAEILKAQILEQLERFPEARQAAERARDAAAQGRDTRRLILALLKLASIVSTHEDDSDEAAAYVTTARSLSLGLALPEKDMVEIEIISASLAQDDGNFVQAVEYANQGLKLLEAVDANGQDYLNAKISLSRIIGAAHFAANEYEEAAKLLRATHALNVKRLGPEHSQLAMSLTNIATVDYKLDKYDEALENLHRARELLKSPDAKRSDIGQALSLEALIQNRLGNLPEAIIAYKETIEVYEELFDADHANVWRTKANLANSLLALERWDETLEIQRGFLAWAIKRYGAESPTAVAAKLNLAQTSIQAHYEDGEVEDGQLILAELTRDLPKGDPTLVGVRVMEGNAFLAQKRFAEAAAAFENALTLEKSAPRPESSFAATTTSAWADALWQDGKRSRAITIAKRALQHYDKLMPAMAEYRAEQEAWIAEKQREMALPLK